MEFNHIIKEIGRGKNHARHLDRQTACALYRQMLAGCVPPLALGAILIALRIKGEGPEEMPGFYQAMQEQVARLKAPAGRPLPVTIPSYNGARRQANLTPLLALLLSKLGFPVLVHGVRDDETRVTSEQVFAALGIQPAGSVAQAQQALDSGELVFISIDTLCPPLAEQLALRWQLGVRNSAHTLAKLLSPFGEQETLRLSSVSHPEYVPRVADFFQQCGASALLLNGSEGEVYANPQRCPAITFIHRGGEPQQLVARQPELTLPAEVLPASRSAEDTAAWITGCLTHQLPVPESLKLQVACCLLAAGGAASVDDGLQQLAAAGY
ncbi:DNA-binding protein YbiB [Erwinia sp. OLTSP20]|uniref:DNA-binding protein YbiB n=1 Tax=unclassified Erwinia TaxID=2622719 RepID=UPI000C185C77|nr:MULTISPECIES: DNA-binding protein YbiB [unclassified Erwinia]PIJ48693.1 DNA-binding protein YbiB [Erwinia sp. OAMSP11]PIJ69317.1 DNA-binding protein YbiB [Erwinia sp. OLSSP12]PIJ79151.1 DNA-binding protein YbiB [Erwinia sp. OLCASP19]PIJ80677.1 DNA-binding protein YbiB [Erwinia sp. OLMTSP26]PIJ82827.1 DNA-binding protein YbiB [Erwinia sp. OLMDSP33]